jgi:Rhodopirellula transposase DDE domain
VSQAHQQADADPSILRASMDAKATVKVGPFSRGGNSRTGTQACDHDFKSEANVTPWGIFLPKYDDLTLYFTPSKVTSDFIVDMLERWWRDNRVRFPLIKTLMLDLDNGPENHSRRTQFMARMVEFAHKYQLNIRLVYYPPYHSKYNRIERCWGILENHWNGDLLDTVGTVLQFAKSMTWKGKHPVVELVEGIYQTGVKLSGKAMAAVESQLQRLPNLGKWFVDILVSAPAPHDLEI